MSKKEKKNFGSLENGCIFALAFAQKSGVLKKGVGEGGRRKDIEKVETRDSVCRSARRRLCARTRRVKGKTKNNSYNEEFDPGSG